LSENTRLGNIRTRLCIKRDTIYFTWHAGFGEREEIHSDRSSAFRYKSVTIVDNANEFLFDVSCVCVCVCFCLYLVSFPIIFNEFNFERWIAIYAFLYNLFESKRSFVVFDDGVHYAIFIYIPFVLYLRLFVRVYRFFFLIIFSISIIKRTDNVTGYVSRRVVSHPS